MRVYGALMWSLGKVIRTPEVLRVYIGRSAQAETGAACTAGRRGVHGGRGSGRDPIRRF